LALVWQLVNIRPYTPLARRMVEDARRPSPECTLRLVIANVLQDNCDYVRFLEVVEREDPDLVLALEVDEAWERELRPLEARRPHLVKHVLDNVAWSHTTNLFLKESGLLDPRMGRGFYNSFDARNPVIRFPLDHVFHSAHFRLVELRRLVKVGSDHFPMLVALSHEPDAAREQEGAEASPADEREVEERIDKGEREEGSRSAGG